MTDYDKLERLVRLRQSGGLSEQEFQTEKAKLLAPPISETSSAARKHWMMAAGGLVAVAIVAASVIAVQRYKASKPNTSISTAPTPTPPVKGSYAWATSIFRVGENPDYLESILGPPQRKSNDSLFYDLQGCPVAYRSKRAQITGIDIAVLENCTPEVRGQTLTPQTAFGSIYGNGGFLQTSCLTLCGNKADPTVEYVIPGAHADNFIGVRYSTYSAEDGVNLWADEIASAEGVASQFDVPRDKFDCPANPSKRVLDAMKSAEVQSVTLGVDVETCEPW